MILDNDDDAAANRYMYFVKIIPDKKSNAKTFEWHGMQEKFLSPGVLENKLKESFNKQLSGHIEIGYIAKKGNRKRWIIGTDDLASMYKQCDAGNAITLFCEACAEPASLGTGTRKHRSSYSDHEDDVKRIALDLSDQHGKTYTEQQFRLWARMIVNGQHSDHEEPPNVPLLTGGTKKTPKKDSFTEAITGAATAFANVLTSSSKVNDGPTTPTHNVPQHTSVSPRSKAQLSSVYIAQLKDLQGLLESGVLTDDEFKEQKEIALQSIRNMNKN